MFIISNRLHLGEMTYTDIPRRLTSHLQRIDHHQVNRNLDSLLRETQHRHNADSTTKRYQVLKSTITTNKPQKLVQYQQEMLVQNRRQILHQRMCRILSPRFHNADKQFNLQAKIQFNSCNQKHLDKR